METFTAATPPSPFGSNSTSTGAVTTAYDLNVTTYNGSTQTVSDQAGIARVSVTDGLGRMKQVQEDPSGTWSFSTIYNYNTLDDLVNVAQSGLATRAFAYDSLKQLTNASNPESGSVSYNYDLNGNLHTRTDARSITTTMTYDVRNRINGKGYSDGTTPSVSYCYDAPPGTSACATTPQTGFVGRETQVANANSTTTYGGYDPLGRVTSTTQSITGGSSYSVAYAYNSSGALTSETYPSGRVVDYSYDGANRVEGITGSWNQVSTNYVQGVSYASHGGVAQMNLGANVEQTCYNERMQPSTIRLGSAATTYCVDTGNTDPLNLG